MWKYLILFLAVFFISSCHSNKNQKIVLPGLHYVDANELSEVFEVAKKKNKPVFFYMQAEWCVPCHFMDENVFQNKDTYRFMNKNFVSFSADMDEVNGQIIAFNYDIKNIPTLLFFDKNGEVLYRYKGSLGNEKMIEIANEVLLKIKP